MEGIHDSVVYSGTNFRRSIRVNIQVLTFINFGSDTTLLRHVKLELISMLDTQGRDVRFIAELSTYQDTGTNTALTAKQYCSMKCSNFNTTS